MTVIGYCVQNKCSDPICEYWMPFHKVYERSRVNKYSHFSSAIAIGGPNGVLSPIIFSKCIHVILRIRLPSSFATAYKLIQRFFRPPCDVYPVQNFPKN